MSKSKNIFLKIFKTSAIRNLSSRFFILFRIMNYAYKIDNKNPDDKH